MLGGYAVRPRRRAMVGQHHPQSRNPDGVTYYAADQDFTLGGPPVSAQALANCHAVADFLNGAASITGWDQVGCYGSLYLLQWLRQNTPLKAGWQTGAWSGGRFANWRWSGNTDPIAGFVQDEFWTDQHPITISGCPVDFSTVLGDWHPRTATAPNGELSMADAASLAAGNTNFATLLDARLTTHRQAAALHDQPRALGSTPWPPRCRSCTALSSTQPKATRRLRRDGQGPRGRASHPHENPGRRPRMSTQASHRAREPLTLVGVVIGVVTFLLVKLRTSTHPPPSRSLPESCRSSVPSSPASSSPRPANSPRHTRGHRRRRRAPSSTPDQERAEVPARNVLPRPGVTTAGTPPRRAPRKPPRTRRPSRS
jgi:hypothetical protein